MRVTIPIYVRQYRAPNTPAARFVARPLFAVKPMRGSTALDRAMTKLAHDLREELARLGRDSSQALLANWTMNPVVERLTIEQPFILRRRTVRTPVLAVALRSGSARLGLFPQLDLWFDIPATSTLCARAVEVLTDHLMHLERDDPKFDAEDLLGSNTKSLLLTSLDVDVDPYPVLPKKLDRSMFMLGSATPADGATELYRVGRLLDAQYPDDLEEAVLRAQEVDELTRRLTDPGRPSVILLGPRGVGKTAIVHQFVRQRLAKADDAGRTKHRLWLISPQRLISGMSYVGQWEDRLLAILKVAAKAEHILYFDDVLGLYLAGQHSKSSLSAADVLRPVLERREVRFLAEMTPEAFRVLRERDRAMADLLESIPVREPAPEQTRRILVTVQRRLEARHRCVFGLDALPTVLDLQQRYVRDIVMPGKAATLMHRLAGGNLHRSIDRKLALAAFGAYSGLAVDFLDTSARLRRVEVVTALSRAVVGQIAAVEAMADAVCIAKARLNDTARPIATFLFLGPTGVGKTECAKALAGYLFGNRSAEAPARAGPNASDRLLRFDMNEYGDPGSASRLIGTFRDPEGLLTSAVRRQPFGVVLLDEIEKAHPAVFDLLLAVLGEGRLTDARGRTTDFTNTIIIMTSNLGVREAGTNFGLRAGGEIDSAARGRYREAAQRFFRPEFFNRIDRVVPFDRLAREDIAGIARRLMDGLLHRDGLIGRRCMLRVDPVALQRIVDAGYHPQLGARALKREVEKRIATPVAAMLAAMPPGEPTVIDVLPGDEAAQAGAMIAVRVTPILPSDALRPTRPQLHDVAWSDAAERTGFLDDILDQAESSLAAVEARVESLSPGSGMTQGRLSHQHFVYLALREQVKLVAGAIGHLDRAVEASTQPPQRNVRKGGRPPQRQGPAWVPLVRHHPVADAWRLLLGGQTLPEVERFGLADDHHERLMDSTASVLDQLALLHVMARDTSQTSSDPDRGDEPEVPARALMLIRCQSGPEPLVPITSAYIAGFERQLGVSVTDVSVMGLSGGSRKPLVLPPTVRALVIEFPAAMAVFGGESGTHLVVGSGDSGLTPIDIRLHPLPPDADPMLAAFRLTERPPADESQPARVVRAYSKSAVLDLRTGLACGCELNGSVLRRMILAALPLPADLGPANREDE